MSAGYGPQNHDRGPTKHSLLWFRPHYNHNYHHNYHQGYGDWSLEPAAPPKGTINGQTNISNIFFQGLDIPKPQNRDPMIPILNLDQNLNKITIAGVNITEHRESLRAH